MANILIMYIVIFIFIVFPKKEITHLWGFELHFHEYGFYSNYSH